MNRHARAAARCAITAVIVGLAAIVFVSVLPMVGRYVTCAALAAVDLALLVYLWLATTPEPDQRLPSATRARIEAARRQREQRGG